MVCHMALRQLNWAKDGNGLDSAILMVGNQWGFAHGVESRLITSTATVSPPVDHSLVSQCPP
jgi:hypothetical protein